MTVPDEAVEAAAREVYHTSGRNRVMPYSQAKESCEGEARQILAAAAPFIAAQAWDEGFDRVFYDPLAGSNRDASESPAKNPYEAKV